MAMPIMLADPPTDPLRLALHQPADGGDAEAVLMALARDGRSVVPLGDLAPLMALADELAALALAEALEAGLVVVWAEAPGGPSIVPTPAGISLVGVALSSGSGRLLAPDDPGVDRFAIEPDQALVASQLAGGDGTGLDLDSMADPSAGPPDAGLVAEEEFRGKWKASLELQRQGRPVPSSLDPRLEPGRFRVLLGQRAIWPPQERDDATCPVCESRPLSTDTYCLWCSRSGKDLLLTLRPADILPRARTTYTPADGLKGGRG
jgi:hypothetical protein